MDGTGRLVRLVVDCPALPNTVTLSLLAPLVEPGQPPLREAMAAYCHDNKTAPVALAAKDLTTGKVRHFRLRPHAIRDHSHKPVVFIDEGACDEMDEDGNTLRSEVPFTGWFDALARTSDTPIGELTIVDP
jgi:hypothetical protein